MKHKKAESILAWIFKDYLQFYITDSRCFNSVTSPLEQFIKFLPMTLKSLVHYYPIEKFSNIYFSRIFFS